VMGLIEDSAGSGAEPGAKAGCGFAARRAGRGWRDTAVVVVLGCPDMRDIDIGEEGGEVEQEPWRRGGFEREPVQ